MRFCATRVKMKLVVFLAFISISLAGMPEYWQRKSNEFMEKKYNEDGVIKTDSGLAYKVLEKGSGSTVTPTKTDKVLVHYRGTLIGRSAF